MTKTPDKIKKGLAENIAVHYHPGDREPRLTPLMMVDLEELHADALALIQQHEAQNAEKDETIQQLESGLLAQADVIATMGDRIQQLEAERDAAVADMHEAQGCLCLICKNHKPDPEKKKYICKAFGDYPFEDGPLICGQFGWRGVQKEGEL